MPFNPTNTFETLGHIENPFAEDKATTVSKIIETISPEGSELEEKWEYFSRRTNPNKDGGLFTYTTQQLLEGDLVNEYGMETEEALEKIIAGSPKYKSYREAATKTYDFFGELVRHNAISGERVQELIESFGSETFPIDTEGLTEMLGVPTHKIPGFTQETFFSMQFVDETMRASTLYAEAVTSIAEKIPTREETISLSESRLTQELNDETKEWAIENGHEYLLEEFSEAEKTQAQELSGLIQEQATEKSAGNPGIAEIIEEVFDGEGEVAEEAREATKLLLRISIKVSVETAVIIARNISKQDKDLPPEIRAMLGAFADGIDKTGKFIDKAIAGDEKANLQRDIINFITDKYN